MMAFRLLGSVSLANSPRSRSFSSLHHQPGAALEDGGQGWVSAQPREGDRRHVEESRITPPSRLGGPIDHLKVDLEADLLELLFGEEGGLVMVLVFLVREQPNRLARITGFSEEPPSLLLVPLVVGAGSDRKSVV